MKRRILKLVLGKSFEYGCITITWWGDTANTKVSQNSYRKVSIVSAWYKLILLLLNSSFKVKWNRDGRQNLNIPHLIYLTLLWKEGMFSGKENSCRSFIKLWVTATSRCSSPVKDQKWLPKFTVHHFDLEGTQSNKFSCHNGKCNYSNCVKNLFQSDKFFS